MQFTPSLNFESDAALNLPDTILAQAAQWKARQDRIAERIERIHGDWLKRQAAFGGATMRRWL